MKGWRGLAGRWPPDRPARAGAGGRHRGGRAGKWHLLMQKAACSSESGGRKRELLSLEWRTELFRAGCAANTHWELGPTVRTFVRLVSLRIQDLLISVKDSSSNFFVPVGDPFTYFQLQL